MGTFTGSFSFFFNYMFTSVHVCACIYTCVRVKGSSQPGLSFLNYFPPPLLPFF